MTIDVLRFLTLPDQNAHIGPSRQTHAMGSATDIITPIDASGYGQWKHIKNPQGWPWDIKLYDENFVYDWITEGPHGWSADPKVGPQSFKKFVKNHAVKNGWLGDGMIMFPRQVDSVENSFEIIIQPPQTTYATFEDCKQVGLAVSLGTVKQTLDGPFLIHHGGDVGAQPTLIHKYFWINNGIPTLEENHYALDWGWVSWKKQELDPASGMYKLKQETGDKFYFRVPGVQIVFSCF